MKNKGKSCIITRLGPDIYLNIHVILCKLLGVYLYNPRYSAMGMARKGGVFQSMMLTLLSIKCLLIIGVIFSTKMFGPLHQNFNYYHINLQHALAAALLLV